MIVTGCVLVFRLLAAGLIHLTEDEAYYRRWSLSPAFGYFDHPPMIAWWIWLGRHIAGDNSLGVRLLPVLSSAATSLIVFDLARLAGAGERAAARAGVWFNATLPGGRHGRHAGHPDAPASLFWQPLTVWSVLRAIKGERVWGLVDRRRRNGGARHHLEIFRLVPGARRAPGAGLHRTRSRATEDALAVARGGHRGRHLRREPRVERRASLALVRENSSGRGRASHRLTGSFILELIGGQFLLLNPLIAIFAVRALMRKPRWLNLDGAWPFAAFSAPFVAYLLLHQPARPRPGPLALAALSRLRDLRGPGGGTI